MDQMVHSELNETLVKICLEKWCTTIHYFAFMYANDGRNKLDVCVLEVHSSLEIYHTGAYTLKYGIKVYSMRILW